MSCCSLSHKHTTSVFLADEDVLSRKLQLRGQMLLLLDVVRPY
jgi:hypothetical protein